MTRNASPISRVVLTDGVASAPAVNLRAGHHSAANGVDARVVLPVPAIRVIRAASKFPPNECFGSSHRNAPTMPCRLVAELLRKIGDEAVVCDDGKDAPGLRRIARFDRLEGLERLGGEKNAVGAVASPREAEAIAPTITIIDRKRRAIGEGLSADPEEPDRRDDVAVDAAHVDRIGPAEAEVIARLLRSKVRRHAAGSTSRRSSCCASTLAPSAGSGASPSVPLSPQRTPSNTSIDVTSRTFSSQSIPASRRRRCSMVEKFRSRVPLTSTGRTASDVQRDIPGPSAKADIGRDLSARGRAGRIGIRPRLHRPSLRGSGELQQRNRE